MKKIYIISKLVMLFNLASIATAFSQSFTISTTPATDTVSGDYSLLTQHAVITFNIQNTTDSPVTLKQVEMIFNYGAFCTGTIPTLWYSSTSLAGISTISEAGEWNVIATGIPVNIIEYNYYPLFQNLSFVIQAHTQYRFALESTKGFREYGTLLNSYTVEGVVLKVGHANVTQTGIDNVGYMGIMPQLSGDPRYFSGRITLEPLSATPVTLLNFTATYNNKNANIINWQTSQELNSKSFTIQKAYNAGQFINVATLPAAGNSDVLKNYTYTDNNIEYKPTYYRLLQTDIDGKITYSKTVQVTPTKSGFAISNIYPNPAHSSIAIEYNSSSNAATTLVITDMVGRQLQQAKLLSVKGFNRAIINITALAKGKYIAALINNGQEVQGTFVKY